MLLLAAAKDAALGQVFSGGGGNSATWKQYASDLSHVLGLSAPKAVPLWLAKALSGGVESVWRLLKIKQRPPVTREALNLVCAETDLPIAKATDMLGYNPEVNYKSGFEGVAKYIREHIL